MDRPLFQHKEFDQARPTFKKEFITFLLKTLSYGMQICQNNIRIPELFDEQLRKLEFLI